ncbi:hypothetical protein ABBQ32_004201 [Trebouxia sp. C0010 RCD-2024]
MPWCCDVTAIQDELQGKAVERITFKEVTQKAVERALASPRQIDSHLVDAYMARRALDYLMGYNISPTLMRKVGAARSAGRVQSPALRILTEQESRIMAFQPEEWWTVDLTLTTPKGQPFKAGLVSVDGVKHKRFDLKTEADAQALGERVAAASFKVKRVSSAMHTRSPSAPYMTSTMLMDAAAQLGQDVAAAMAAAQRLFEGDVHGALGESDEGLITYMRTDSPTLDDTAAQEIREAVKAIYGLDFLSSEANLYKMQNSPSAQEGHGAISPTHPMRVPEAIFKQMDKVKGAWPSPEKLSPSQKKLYELIWRRALASQMTGSVFKTVSVELENADGSLQLKTTATQVLFAGFLRAFEGFDIGVEVQMDDDEGDASPSQADPHYSEKNSLARLTMTLQEGDQIGVAGAPPKQHFTKAPPRFSEANLVKTLQEKGIGRPSTYGTIIKGLQERGYAVKEGRRLKPTGMGKVVVAFLQGNFNQYLDYDYTSLMESQLDEIAGAGGRAKYLKLLGDFWPELTSCTQAAEAVPVREVVDQLDAALGPMLFPLKEGQTEEEARTCPACAKGGRQGRLGLKPARTGQGGFVGCSNYPDCSYSRSLDSLIPLDAEVAQKFPGLSEGPVLLGQHPRTMEDILLRVGPYGPYLQVGTPQSASAVEVPPKAGKLARGKKPKSNSKPKTRARMVAVGKFDLLRLELSTAMELLQWPKLLGDDPKGDQVYMTRTQKGYYHVQRGEVKACIPSDTKPGDIDLEDALQILADNLKAQEKKVSKARAVRRRAVASSDTGVSSRGDVATSDDEVQTSSSSSSSSSSKALNAGGETDAAGGSSVKKRTKRKYVKAKMSSTVSASGTAASVGTASTTAVKDRGKGKPADVSKVQGQGRADAAVAPIPKKGYRAFWSQMWAKLRVDDPGVKMTDANKQIASAWKHMDAESKKQYN